MLIKARTVFTEETLREYYTFILDKNGKRATFFRVFGQISILILLACSLYLFFTRFFSGDIFIAFVTAILCVLFLVVLIFCPRFLSRTFITIFVSSLAKHSNNTIGTAADFEFSEHEVFINTLLPTVVEDIRVNYSFFQIVYETNDFFYLFTSSQTAYILKKAGIYVGSTPELRDLLQKNMPPDKYIIRNV